MKGSRCIILRYAKALLCMAPIPTLVLIILLRNKKIKLFNVCCVHIMMCTEKNNTSYS